MILKQGHALGKAELLFEKIEDDVIQKQIDKLKNTQENSEAKPEPDKVVLQKAETSFGPELSKVKSAVSGDEPECG